MKRFLIALLTLLLLTSAASAEMPDFSSMPFEELSAWKQALDKEYNSRPESGGLTLGEGVYEIGKDLSAGHYYVAMLEPDRGSTQSCILIYDNMETYKEDDPMYAALAKNETYIVSGETPQMLILEAPNVLVIESGSLFIKTSMFDPQDYVESEPSVEGTPIPKGEYIIGEDIPAGTYDVYPGSRGKTTMVHYYFEEKEDGTQIERTKIRETNKNEPPARIKVKNGDRLEIYYDVIFKKAEAFAFD